MAGVTQYTIEVTTRCTYTIPSFDSNEALMLAIAFYRSDPPTHIRAEVMAPVRIDEPAPEKNVVELDDWRRADA